MSYMGTHNKIRKIRGSSKLYRCVQCGAQASQWAYSNASPDEKVDKLGRRYSQNIFDDYAPMCLHCHMVFDKALITNCPQRHPYSGANLLMDAGKRKCKTCVYARNRARRVSPAQKARKIELQRARRGMAKVIAA